ncbi:hypothetical protein [Burkholderia sp. Nafp2/4-1b]|uniref:hypothetical protein n=1 Tax=Burkholderia sp. Nafp2/4-1b TaxID=2116686 RepID=UPI0013CF10C1|nr:hypothetical protein [Burkholderia sp. Nafp2/4-1b]
MLSGYIRYAIAGAQASYSCAALGHGRESLRREYGRGLRHGVLVAAGYVSVQRCWQEKIGPKRMDTPTTRGPVSNFVFKAYDALTAEAFDAATLALKKALIERALGGEMTRSKLVQ